MPIITPCISVCTIDEETGLCRGCCRSLDEVTRWVKMTDEERDRVMKALPERRKDAGLPPSEY